MAKKKRNPSDLTVRDRRHHNRQNRELKTQLRAVSKRLATLERRVARVFGW